MPDEKPEEYNDQDLRDMLPIYYKRLFPHEPFYRWISYGQSESSIFTHREFSFTLADDVYIRYLSYENRKEFENDLCTKNPFKIDIGAVMTSRPRDHRTANVQPVQRELIFDIDMTDYDEVRTCCSGAEICQKCWKFMVVACQILDSALRDDFNFENILWVFSGRRGIHCWVCDKTARYLSNKNRNAVAEYLNLFSSVQNSVSRVSLSGDRMHHSVKRAYQIVDSHFEDICLNDQNIFATEKGQKKLLELIPDENLRKDIEANIKATETNDSKVIWDIVTRLVNVNRNQNQMQRKMKFLIEEIQMSMLCPRLDISVSKVANHLLKAPFCVHPKTGKICVPFNAAAVSKFDPTTVPTIRQLLKEIDDYDKKNIDKTTEGDIAEKQSKILGYKKTAMLKGICVFEEFLHKLKSTFKPNIKLELSDAKMEF